MNIGIRYYSAQFNEHLCNIHLHTKFNIFGQKTVVPYVTHKTSVLGKGQHFLTKNSQKSAKSQSM